MRPRPPIFFTFMLLLALDRHAAEASLRADGGPPESLPVLRPLSYISAIAVRESAGRRDRPWRRATDDDGVRKPVPRNGPEGFLPGFDPPWAPEEAREVRLDPTSSFAWGVGVELNRVDGWTLLARQSLLNRGAMPSISFYEGYATKSEEWSGAAEATLPLGSRAVQLRARWADELVPFFLPAQPLEADENATAAVLLREDYRDYLRRRGQAYSLEWNPRVGHFLQVAFLDETHEAEERRVGRYGLFGGRKLFRDNPEALEGDWQILRARGVISAPTRRASWALAPVPALLVDALWTGGELDAPRTFMRLYGEHRGQVRLNRSQALGYRVGGGTTLEGPRGEDESRLPLQWQFQAGGVGSLRGHDFQAFRGDRVVLLTAEYAIDVGGEVQPMLFLDSGKAWNEADDRAGGVFGSGPLELDGGLGLQLGRRGPRVDVARDLRREHAEAKVSVRFALPY